MKRCTYCGREGEDGALHCWECGTRFADPPADRDRQGPEAAARGLLPGLKAWSLVGFVASVALLAALSTRLPHRARSGTAPRILVLAAWYSNGQQFVTFRPDPPTAEVTCAGLVPASVDANAQPRTVRSFGEVFPIPGAQETNYSLYFVAMPERTVPVPGSPPVAYTPGSYTIAYAPTEDGCRVRAGVALERKGIGEYFGRLRSSWEHKSPVRLLTKSYQDPVFVVFGPATNAVHGKP